ncbi:MAG TPA: ABC transporter ATP-binding protein/permease [Planktothrix sp.]|jgi:putative ATP-binding cassette transporter
MSERKPRPAPQTLWQRLLVLTGLSYVLNLVEERRANGTKAIWRGFFAVAKPFWFANGFKSALGLLALTLFTVASYFGLQLAVSQVDVVTKAILGSLSQGYTHFALFYALPAIIGCAAIGWLCKRFAPKSERVKGYLLLGMLLLLMLAVNSLNVILNFANGAIMTAMNQHDQHTFTVMVIRLLSVFVIGTFIVVFYAYVQTKLTLVWRRFLTNWIMDKYFTKRAHYRINQDNKIDNPDERIAMDVDVFVSYALSLLLSVLGSIITYYTFVGILRSAAVDPTHSLTKIAYIWSAVFTLLALGVGRKLKGLNFMKMRREADFRFNLIHVRNNSESIAFYRGENKERDQVRLRFSDLMKTWDELIGWTRNLGFVQTGSNYFTVAIPFLVLGPLYFAGKVELGVISQASMAFGQVLSALTLVVSSFGDFSTFAASIDRLSAFVFELDEEKAHGPNRPAIESVEDGRLALEKVTLMTPDYSRTLVKDLTVEVTPSQGLVIMGRSGSGKSSLLRALGSLWNSGTGTIHRPSQNDMLFLPQRPYMILGSLRDQLLYPSTTGVSDEDLQSILEEVNLPDLVKRVGGFDTVLSFADVLSLGEQQRVAFARLLLTKPKYAILDEATSALDAANEEHLYTMLKNSGTTFVSVGHRPSLIKYHTNLLELDGQGGYRVVATSTLNQGQPDNCK